MAQAFPFSSDEKYDSSKDIKMCICFEHINSFESMKLGMKIRCGRIRGEDGSWRRKLCPMPGFMCKVRHGRNSGRCISSNEIIAN